MRNSVSIEVILRTENNSSAVGILHLEYNVANSFRFCLTTDYQNNENSRIIGVRSITNCRNRCIATMHKAIENHVFSADFLL